MPHDTRNRACTAIGNSNFGTKLGASSLTDCVKFVIISSAIDERLKNSKTVMSYQEWFEELKMLSKFW